MIQTPKLKLNKPDYSSVSDIVKLNDNFQKIDDALGDTPSKIVNLEGGQTRLELINGLNDNNTEFTYTGDNLTMAEEKNGSTVVRRVTITYNPDGTMNTVTDMIIGATVTSTLTYTSGNISKVTKTKTQGGL